MNQRDNSIDMLRGLAIFAMIAANMSAHSYQEPHPYWFRIFGSIAAPIFVFLAGYMVGFTFHNKHYPVSYYLKRGLFIVITGAIIDLGCWQAVPFTTFDVLYVIGLSLPLARLFLSLNKWFGIALIAFIFAFTPFLQFYLGYDRDVTEPSLSLVATEGMQGAIVWKQFLVDGWFPVFPWLAVALLGAFSGHWRSANEIGKSNKVFLISGGISFVFGLVTWIIYNPELFEREGYSELFYPPTIMFFAVYLGSIFMLLPAFYYLQKVKVLMFFSVYGRSSLLMYILHTVFNVFIFNEFFGTYELPGFLALFLVHAFILWLISLAIQYIKKGKKLPFILSVLLGG